MSESKYCMECKTIINEDNKHNNSHNLLPLEEWYEEKKKLNIIRRDMLLRSKNTLEIGSSDIELLKELIDKKEKKLNDSLASLKRIKGEINGRERVLSMTKTRCEELTAKMEHGDEITGNIEELDPSEHAIAIVMLKNELETMSGDLNLQSIAEALVLDYVVENERIKYECLKKIKFKDSKIVKELEEMAATLEAINTEQKNATPALNKPLYTKDTSVQGNVELQGILKDNQNEIEKLKQLTTSLMYGINQISADVGEIVDKEELINILDNAKNKLMNYNPSEEVKVDNVNNKGEEEIKRLKDFISQAKRESHKIISDLQDYVNANLKSYISLLRENIKKIEEAFSSAKKKVETLYSTVESDSQAGGVKALSSNPGGEKDSPSTAPTIIKGNIDTSLNERPKHLSEKQRHLNTDKTTDDRSSDRYRSHIMRFTKPQ